MKRITCAFLSMLLITPCMANIHINPDAVTEVVAKHFLKKQVECIREYNAQLKASNGAGIAASKLWNVCAAGGLDIKQPADKEKCRAFVNDLTRKGTVKFYAACGKDKSVSGAVCINDFTALTVNMQQAQGLAKLYARSKSDNTIQCRSKPRIESTTTTSVNPHAMGMSSTSNTPYLQCTSYNSNKFYEFRFNSVDGNIDAANHKNFKTGICKIFGSKLIQKDLYGYKWDICSDIKDETACNKIDNVVSAGNIGYIASWGPAGYKLGDRGYQITSTSLPYCILTESVTNGNDSTLLFERTAFGLDGRVFLNAGVQRKGSNEIKKQIRAYVENTMGKENVKSFSCEDNYHTVKLKGRSGKDDMLRCTVNDKTVEFFFDDLSESWGVYDKSGHEAMNCIAWGGTFTGKKCIGLDEKMCNTVRDANAQSCPECKSIKWNPDTETCDLPSSANATSLKRGLTYSAIVGGAVVSVVITVGSLGTATAPTVLVLTGLGVELTGSVIELKAQHAIYTKTDEFFEKANACNNQTCSEKLIKEYLQALSNQQNDMQDAEISAADKIFTKLFEQIPANSPFYKDIIEQGLKGQTLESNKLGFFDAKSWNSEQVWRAVGIALQIIPTVASIGWRIAKKSDKLVNSTAKLRSKLDDASKYIDDALGLKQTDDAIAVMDMWNGATSGTGNSLQKELTLLEELKDARQGKTGSRLGSAVLDDLSEETKKLLAQNGNNVDAVIRQMSKGLESVNQNTLVLNRELELLDELENAKQAKTGSRMYSGVYEDLSKETKRLLVQNGNDISKARQRLNLAAQKLEYKPGNQTLGDFILSPDLESIGGEYSTWNSGLSKLKKDVVTKQANGEDATQALAKLRNAASDAVDARLIEQNAVFYKENIARILASDEDLLNQFNNFENLSHGEKERFIRTFINRHGTNLGVSEDVEISLISKFPDDPEKIGMCCGVNNVTGKRIIYISEDNLIKAGKGSAKNGLIAAPSHEYGHFVDGVAPNKGVLGSQVSDISKNFYGKTSNKTLEGWLTYTSRPTEKSSFPIGYIVRDDFSGGLRQTITTGKMPTTTISKIDDFKIKYAVPNINPTYVENGGDAYFFIPARPENITGLSNYFRQKGLRVKTTSDGVRVFETP